MIVPNKEFITTKLVNWTLSDSKRRIDIPLRVAYGADLDKVKETLLEQVERAGDGEAEVLFCAGWPRTLLRRGEHPILLQRRLDNMHRQMHGQMDHDKLHEECGVFGIWGHPKAAELTYLGLYALQHRGSDGSIAYTYFDRYPFFFSS